MRSRMERYHQNEEVCDVVGSRSDKNQQLYQNLGKNTKYTSFTDISQVNAVDLDAATKSYRTREGYHQIKDYGEIIEQPKVKRELDDFNYLYQDHENRVYDINSVLKSAKEHREEKDELEKKRKLKNTNYNILASLDPEELEKYRASKQKHNSPDPDELKELIDTITSKTLKGEIDKETSVDLLSDLMATKTTDQVKLEDLDLSRDIVDKDPIEKAKEEVKNSELDDMDKSFYTRSMDLSDKDFGLDDEIEKHIPTLIKVVLVVILLAILAVAVYFIIQVI